MVHVRGEHPCRSPSVRRMWLQRGVTALGHRMTTNSADATLLLNPHLPFAVESALQQERWATGPLHQGHRGVPDQLTFHCPSLGQGIPFLPEGPADHGRQSVCTSVFR